MAELRVGDRVRLLAYGDEVIERVVVGFTDTGRLCISSVEEVEQARRDGRKPHQLAWPEGDVLGRVDG